MRVRSVSRSSLFLMELILVILFFAIAAAVCLQVFASANQIAERGRNLSCAVLAAQSAAESCQASAGDLGLAAIVLGGETSGEVLTVGYDADWQRTTLSEAQYQMKLEKDGVWADIVVMQTGGMDPIYTLRIRVLGGGNA